MSKILSCLRSDRLMKVSFNNKFTRYRSLKIVMVLAIQTYEQMYSINELELILLEHLV